MAAILTGPGNAWKSATPSANSCRSSSTSVPARFFARSRKVFAAALSSPTRPTSSCTSAACARDVSWRSRSSRADSSRRVASSVDRSMHLWCSASLHDLLACSWPRSSPTTARKASPAPSSFGKPSKAVSRSVPMACEVSRSSSCQASSVLFSSALWSLSCSNCCLNSSTCFFCAIACFSTEGTISAIDVAPRCPGARCASSPAMVPDAATPDAAVPAVMVPVPRATAPDTAVPDAVGPDVATALLAAEALLEPETREPAAFRLGLLKKPFWMTADPSELPFVPATFPATPPPPASSVRAFWF
mmetsp:Transcript_72769/g.168673  ORF Transcript_72769/g.168673 Transcript_72769/m.168673 type:complete len:303 (-) Transcript_72769:658-1566(-)